MSAFLSKLKQYDVSPKDVFFSIVYLLCSILFTIIYFRTTDEYQKAALVALTDFSGNTPFQYRVLTLIVARMVHLIVAVNVIQIYRVMTICWVFLTLILFRNYLHRFMPSRNTDTYALVLFYPLLWNYCILSPFFFPWDIPAIAFFILGLLYMVDRRWMAYYVVFILASLNRETSCFLVVAYILVEIGRRDTKPIVANVLVQTLIWLLIKYTLTMMFSANPGAKVFENHMRNNINFYLTTREWGLPIISRMFTFGFLWALIPLYWKRQPLFFKKMLLIAVPFLTGMSIVGNLFEARIYSELVPIIVGPAIFAIHTLVADSPGSHRSVEPC